MVPWEKAWHAVIDCTFPNESQMTLGFLTVALLDSNGKKLVAQQFTGLNDITGKEIYEGDVVDSNWSNWNNRGVVIFWGGEFRSCFINCYVSVNGNIPLTWTGNCWYVSLSEMYCSSPATEFNVLGNIFENPELLK